MAWPGSPGRTEPPGGPSAATSTKTLVTRCTWTSRSLAGSPTVEGTKSWAAKRVRGTRPARLRTGARDMPIWIMLVDDRSRLAYTEILADEKKETAAGFWQRANTYFASCGVRVKRVLTDNGSCYRSKKFAKALGKDITHKRTRAYRPRNSTARSNATTAPCSKNGPTLSPTPQRPNASLPSLNGYTTTITTEANTSLKGQPPASRWYPTSLEITPSKGNLIATEAGGNRNWQA